MIGPQDLKYFIELSKTLHVSRAAERLGITQPALSHAVKRMEIELGRELFIRSKKGVELSSAGHRLLDSADELNRQWARLASAVKEDEVEVSGLIRLGCHTAVAQYTLPHFLPQLLKDNPKLEIKLEHGLSREMTEQVVSSKIDVAFAINAAPHPDLIMKELFRDQVTFWKKRGLANADVLCVEPNLLQSQSILAKSAKRGIRFERVLESSSLEVIAQLVTAGAGIGILPTRVAEAFSDGKVERVENAPVFDDVLYLIYKRDFIKNARGKDFVKTVTAKLKTT